ncbi:hypothetical protein RHGRI_032489 [Rhododendron griersonianum]|uniref:Uncharacterized protein n=1 Tax=Rhododendron griersonianum TaxID=479676 RepID=A0AAV6IEC7_9ERIC|nr:hypothetical protein RHGRI_032489 [Rhododendron griersonianum]
MDGEQATPPPALKEIIVYEKWWESLEWDDPLTKTILQPCVDYTLLDSDDDYSEDSDDELIDLNKSPDRTVDLLSSMSSDSIHVNK